MQEHGGVGGGKTGDLSYSVSQSFILSVHHSKGVQARLKIVVILKSRMCQQQQQRDDEGGDDADDEPHHQL